MQVKKTYTHTISSNAFYEIYHNYYSIKNNADNDETTMEKEK